MVEKLAIWQKLRELHAYTVIALRKYPKSERFTLGQKTQNKILDMVETTIAANEAADKGDLIEKLDTQMSQLRFLFDTAYEIGILAVKQYRTIAEKNVEIGRMIGGWKKKFKK